MRTWLHALYAALILTGVVVGCWRIERASSAIRGAATEMILETQTLRERIERMLTSSWKDAAGVTRTVSNTQKDGETWAQFIDRHDSNVEAAKVKWPVGV